MERITTETILGMQFDIYHDVNDPWFMASQIAEAVEYSSKNVDRMLRLVRSCDKERVDMSNYPTRRRVNRGTPYKWFVNEDGLYDILIRSDKPIAEDLRYEFRRLLKELRSSGNLRTINTLRSLSFEDIVHIETILDEPLD